MLLLAAAPGVADEDHEAARRLKQAGEILPLEQVLDKAGATHPGRVLEVELEREKGRYIYELEVLTDENIVWELKYDARSGALIETEKEH